ncbi:MAG: GAF domain-containing protein [Ignavibacteriota bacterium]
MRANGVRSYCVLPLVTAQHDLVGLAFGSERANAYSDEDIEFMQQVARQVAVAVDNALNHEAARAYEDQLKRERDRLSALLEINNAVGHLSLPQAPLSGDLGISAADLRPGLRQPDDLRRRDFRLTPADARPASRCRRHP